MDRVCRTPWIQPGGIGGTQRRLGECREVSSRFEGPAGRWAGLRLASGRPFSSAATHLDIITTPREYTDFFGTQTPNPAITRVTCPILAFFGSKGDIGGEKALNLLKSSVQRLSHGPRRVETTVIGNGDHEYVGEEAQVAQTIARWAEAELLRH